MKKTCKRLIAIFCSLMLISGSVFATNALQADANTYSVLFSDDFDDYGDNASGVANKNAMLAKGWNTPSKNLNNTTANYNRGAYYRIPYNKTVTLLTNNLSGAEVWTDYSVEAMLNYELEDGITGSTIAALVGRANSSSSTGYYLEMVKGSITAKSATLRLRCDAAILVSTAISSLELNADFTLRMKFDGTTIYGYYNNECLITYDTKDDATKYASGYAGIRKTTTSGCNVIFDDFLVSKTLDMAYPEGYYYYNDFNSTTCTLAQEGWTGSGTKTEEAYSLPAGGAGYLEHVIGSDSWSAYIVEAEAKIMSGGATVGYASIVARSTDTTKNGYEFRMVYNAEGTSLVLYKRATRGVTLATYKLDFALDTYYKLTMSVCENNIMCWFGDTLVFDCVDTDNPYLQGYTGVRSPGANTNLNSMYDNYSVREYVDPEVVYPDGYYYYNDFESVRSLKKEGWQSEGAKVNGVYVLNGATANYLKELEGSLEWTDYVVEADVMLNDDGTTPQYASIIARSTDTTRNGYEYRLVKDENSTYVCLYKRGVSGGRINKIEYKFNISVVPNEFNHMKMVVKGAEIICYFNGIRVFEVTDLDAQLNGYAGVRSPAGTASSSYDNFVVREILDTDIVTETQLQKPAGNIWFYDDFTADNSFTERGWDTDNVEIYNSAVKVNGRFVVDGIEGAEKWRNYEVEAVVTVDKSSGMIGEATTGWASVCMRTINSATGYEYGIVTPASSAPYLRLYDRAKKENILVDKTLNIEEGAHTLTMACVGDIITCYFDKELVFTAQSNSASAGYAAVRASGYPTYYKSFTVRTVTANSVLTPNGVASPATGDALNNIVNISFVVFVISTVGLIMTICYKRKVKV